MLRVGYNRGVRAPTDAQLRALTWVVALTAAVVVLVYPFTVARYPPITDLPFHAAQTSIIANYRDPAFHFAAQFELHPLDVPYVTMYALGALATLAVPIHVAVKVMAIAMLALLPLGLVVLLSGMRKNPLLGLFGLGFAFTDLTHWGFFSFIGALGLYAASIGLTLRLLDAPSGRRQLALFVALVLLFFTHVYRFPYAILAISLTTLLMFPATRQVKPVLLPVGVALAGFLSWFATRPKTLSGGLGPIELDTTRAARFGQFTFGSYVGQSGAIERELAWLMLAGVVAVLGLALVFRDSKPTADDSSRRFRRRVALLPLLLAGGHLLAFFTLPSRVGEWWYVYPRELPAALFVLAAALPDLPRRRGVQLAAAAVIAVCASTMAVFVATRWRAFEAETADFRDVAQNLPPSPKLAYLVIDHALAGSAGEKRNSPMVHLPAWIQAERGGWLSFHFAGWRIFPVWYRPNSTDTPPPVPRDWEWNPSWFRVTEQGLFFDWFLVRLLDDPAPLFADDPTIKLVEHRGSWWLYRRDTGQVFDDALR